jgi:hypothetical protein
MLIFTDQWMVIGFAFNMFWMHFERAEGASRMQVPYAAQSSSKVVKSVIPNPS